MTIRGRIALVSATAVAIAVVLISISAYLGAQRQLMTQVDESLLERESVVAEMRPSFIFNLLGVERGGFQSGRFIPPSPGDFDTSYYQLILADGETVNVGDDDLVLPEPEPSDIYSEAPTIRSVWVDDVHLRVLTFRHTTGDATIQIARPLTEVDAALNDLAVLLMIVSVVGVGLAGGMGLIIARQAIKPINVLTATIGGLAGHRELTQRVEVVGDDEVAELSKEFNLLLEELEISKKEQSRLVRDAGHELRTPLTALRTNLDVLQRHEIDPDERETILRAAHTEVEELAALITEVVDLASDRYEEEPMGPVDLSELVESVVSRFSGIREGELIVTADDSVVMGRRQALERALTNIVGNADKFSPPKSPVTVDVKEGVITVSDEGPGFSKLDMPFVFERFYRSDEARSQPGSGLGLSIVRQIIEDHDGEVFARNLVTGGAEVGFRFDTSS